MTEQNLLELAKQGDARAIASLLDNELQSKGITTKAIIKDSYLQLMIEADQVPNQQTAVAFVCKWLNVLQRTTEP